MTNQTEVMLTFPHLDDAAAGEQAQSLLHELHQNAELVPHLDRKNTAVARTDPEAQDFGVTLVAVLGTPAVIILAKAIRDWMERTGTKVEANGIVLGNVRSQDAAAIVAASRKTGGDGARPSGKNADHGPAIKGRTEAKGRAQGAAGYIPAKGGSRTTEAGRQVKAEGLNPLLQSVAIILGASSWPNHRATFKGHRGFRNSATGFRDYLLRNGLPKDKLLWLFDSKVQPGQLTVTMANFLGRAAPLKSEAVRNVIFYYVGHGAYFGESYVVAPRCCHSKALTGTTLPVREIAKVLAGEAPDKRQIVILDACYAAGATKVFLEQGPAEPAKVVADQLYEYLSDSDIERGTALFCAAGARMKAKLPRKDSYTMFSGALLRSLGKGYPGAGPLIALDTLARLVRADIRDNFGIEGVRRNCTCRSRIRATSVSFPSSRTRPAPSSRSRRQ